MVLPGLSQHLSLEKQGYYYSFAPTLRLWRRHLLLAIACCISQNSIREPEGLHRDKRSLSWKLHNQIQSVDAVSPGRAQVLLCGQWTSFPTSSHAQKSQVSLFLKEGTGHPLRIPAS